MSLKRGPFGVRRWQASGETGGRSVLTSSDFTYLGLFRLPWAYPQPFSYSRGAMTRRADNGHFIVAGGTASGIAVSEMPIEIAAPTSPAYGTNLATAPVATVVREWGDVYDTVTNENNKRHIRPDAGTGGSESPGWTFGFHWYNGQLYWTFTSNYMAFYYNTSLGTSVLNDGDGSHTSYGPWRGSLFPNKGLNGVMTDVPAWFQSAYGVGPLATIPSVHGAQASTPYGPTVIAFTPPSNGTAADAYDVDGEQSITLTKLAYFDINHKASRGTNYKICGFNTPAAATTTTAAVSEGASTIPVAEISGFVGHTRLNQDIGASYSGTSATSGPGNLTGVTGLTHAFSNGEAISVWVYDPALGGPTYTPDGTFGGGIETTLDWIDTGCWIDTGTKHGVVMLGKLSDTIPGHSYTGDTVCHYWYGPSTCAHGQTAWSGYQATGPNNHTAVHTVWIYDPMDFVPIIQGGNAWEITPDSTFQLGTVGFPTSEARCNYQFGGMCFDSATKLLYVCETTAEVSGYGYDYIPVIHVFQVS